MEDIVKNLKEEFEKSLAHFQQEIAQLRSSRPSPALVENIIVDCYQSKMPLKQVAAISIMPPSTIVLEPWDKDVIPAIIQAIGSSNLNVAPIADGNNIRLNLPRLSEERRNQLIKLLNEFAEQGRVALRTGREHANKKVESGFKEKSISEDHKFRMKEEVQKLTDNYIEKIKIITEKKEKELKE